MTRSNESPSDHKQMASHQPFLPDSDNDKIESLQQETAETLGLPRYFSDNLNVGGNGPKLAVIPAGQY
ncbi:MAG TPA: hypothetical protein EYH16_02050, partial [Leucothrix mucor]|nr:hypothetical protein [Leucothrix mucor]